MKKLCVSAICVIVLSAGIMGQSQAAKPEDKIKFRQSGMMFMRWNMGVIKGQLANKPQEYNKQQVIAAANVIAAVAHSGMGALFSADTATGKGWQETRIKAAYFEQPDKAKARSQEFIREADAMVTVANTGDPGMVKTQFNKLFESCKSCHKNFRNKE